MGYAESGRRLVPSEQAPAWQTRAEDYLRAITRKTRAEAHALGYGWNWDMATYAAMDALYLEESAGGKTAESVGGYSATFDRAGTSDSRIYQAVRAYLLNTGMLYTGPVT